MNFKQIGFALAVAAIIVIFSYLNKPSPQLTGSDSKKPAYKVVSPEKSSPIQKDTLSFEFPYVANPDSPSEIQTVSEKISKQPQTPKSITISYTSSPNTPGKGIGPNFELLKFLADSKIERINFHFDGGGMVLGEKSLHEFARLVNSDQMPDYDFWINLDVKTPEICSKIIGDESKKFQDWVKSNTKKSTEKTCARANIGWVILHEPK